MQWHMSFICFIGVFHSRPFLSNQNIKFSTSSPIFTAHLVLLLHDILPLTFSSKKCALHRAVILGTRWSWSTDQATWAYFFHHETSTSTSLINVSRKLLERSKSQDQLNQIHAQMLVSGFYKDDVMMTKLLNHPSGKGPINVSLASNCVESPKALLWTSMIRFYSCCGPFREGIASYAQIRHHFSQPSNFDVPFALKCCAMLKALFEGEQVHADVVKLGFVSDVFVQTALLDMYVKCGDVETAEQVFDEMRVKSVVFWTAIIAGYCKHGLLSKAKRLFYAMPARNIITWNAMIDGLVRFGCMDDAEQYFDHMPQRNVVSWTIMINGHSKSGDIRKARLLFDKMNLREVVAWTAMISCYVENGEPGEAIRLFHEMLAANLKPDEVTMLAVISAAAQLQSLHLCAWIENCINNEGFGNDTRILNAITNMYMQCGIVQKAFDIFQKIPKKDVISYNSMITGCATHGKAEDVFNLFSMMTRANIRPNSITFVGILTACAHRGLVEEGRSYFRLMLDLSHVVLKSEHYACMVDLLGRAGHLDEAVSLILSMPIRPEASTWGALLGACRIHGNLMLAEVVAQKLFKIEAENPGNYAVLANMYSEKRMWDKAAAVRRVMEKKKMFKTPGSSWTESSTI